MRKIVLSTGIVFALAYSTGAHALSCQQFAAAVKQQKQAVDASLAISDHESSDYCKANKMRAAASRILGNYSASWLAKCHVTEMAPSIYKILFDKESVAKDIRHAAMVCGDPNWTKAR